MSGHGLSPMLPVDLLPLKLATWNSASLLGGLHSLPVRWRRKRRELEYLTSTCDIVCVQEARGVAADLHFLPHSPHYFHSFLPVALGGFSSREGGVLIAVRRSLHDRAHVAELTVLRPGRILALRLAIGESVLLIVNAHMDPALGVVARARCLREVRCYLDARPGVPALLGGDWNFVHMDDTVARRCRGG